MPRQRSFLTQLDPAELERVLRHPGQLNAVQLIAQLLAHLRSCDTWEDYFAFQGTLFREIYEAEGRVREVRRALKRVQDGKKPQPKVVQLLATQSVPVTVQDWDLELFTHRRVVRQLRSVGDALAWRLFDFDRRFILVLASNQSPGRLAPDEGLGWELGAVTDLWRDKGHFALLNDLTNCVRITDLIEFTRDGKRWLREVKKPGARRDPAQLQRAQMAVNALMSGGPLPGRDQGTRLVAASQQFKTNLPALATALDRAEAEGLSVKRLAGGRVLTCASMIKAAQLFGPAGAIARREKLRTSAFSKAGLTQARHVVSITITAPIKLRAIPGLLPTGSIHDPSGVRQTHL